MAACWFLNDVACSYELFVSVPLIRTFIRKFKFTYKMRVNVIDEYAVQAAHISKPFLVEEAYVQLEKRYGITKQMWYKTEDLISGTPGTFLVSPVFNLLATVDYN